jgi:hypothetical protein
MIRVGSSFRFLKNGGKKQNGFVPVLRVILRSNLLENFHHCFLNVHSVDDGTKGLPVAMKVQSSTDVDLALETIDYYVVQRIV